MAAELTNHPWGMEELLTHLVSYKGKKEHHQL